jgi:nitroreductase
MTELNDRSTPMSLLLSRRSGKARDMIAPGPGDAQLQRILTAASRVPDHGKLTPWRFVVVPQERRAALADALETAYAAEKPEAGRLERKAIRDFPMQAPCLVVVLHRPNAESHIPLGEQATSAAFAAMMLMLAAHAEGFAANLLTGWWAESPAARDILGQAGDSIVGYVFIGTPGKPLVERPRPALEDVVETWTAPRA